MTPSRDDIRRLVEEAAAAVLAEQPAFRAALTTDAREQIALQRRGAAGHLRQAPAAAGQRSVPRLDATGGGSASPGLPRISRPATMIAPHLADIERELVRRRLQPDLPGGSP